MLEEEKKYKNVISALKSLPKIKSKSDFEQRLYRRLKDAEPERTLSPAFEKLTRPKEKNWIFNIFKPSFAPAIGLTIVLIAVVVIYLNYEPSDDQVTQTEQAPRKNEEMVIKEPGRLEDLTTTPTQEDNGLISRDMTDKESFDERSPMPVNPKSDVDASPSPTLSGPEKVEETTVPLMEQKLERKEADEKVMEKEGFIEKKSGDLKKKEDVETKKSNKTDEELNLKKNVGDDIIQKSIEPSKGLDKSRAKDSLKLDSIKSKKSDDKGKDNGQMNQKTETEEQKQAEPIKQEPNKEDK
jgi:hypothetical protein